MLSIESGVHDPLHRPKLLLVDDDEVSLMLIAVALRERGFDVVEASSGDRALQLLTERPTDAVVLDAMMPGRDGFETCRALRATPGHEHLPVLMLTGLDDNASITRAFEAGATDFFVKSHQWSLLAGRLHYLLRASQTRQELERSKAKLARAQDLARMGSFDWRRSVDEGVSTFVLSPEGLRVFGVAPHGSMSMRQVLRMVPLAERNGLMRVLRDVLSSSSVLATDVPVTVIDGRPRILHVEAEPEFDDAGHCVGYTGIVQDVTDRRQSKLPMRARSCARASLALLRSSSCRVCDARSR